MQIYPYRLAPIAVHDTLIHCGNVGFHPNRSQSLAVLPLCLHPYKRGIQVFHHWKGRKSVSSSAPDTSVDVALEPTFGRDTARSSPLVLFRSQRLLGLSRNRRNTTKYINKNFVI